MNVSDLLKSLSYGELSNLSISGEGSGEILEDKIPKVINHINDGLLQLHTKFVLSWKTLILKMQEGRTDYPLRIEYTESQNLSKFPQYIIDRNDPYTGDLIKIMAVTDSCGQELPLNDEENCYSLFTPTPMILQVPFPSIIQLMSVSYQANHIKLSADRLDQQIELPETLHEALRLSVAAAIYSGMNGAENTAKAAEYRTRFDLICNEIALTDVTNSSVSFTNTRFSKRGWI